MGNNPYLFIGALDFSPYIVSVSSPSIALRGLSLELETELYFLIANNRRFNSIGYVQMDINANHIGVASCIGCGVLESAIYSEQGKLGLTLVHKSKALSYFIWARNLDNKWYTKSDPKRESWRKEKQAKLL